MKSFVVFVYITIENLEQAKVLCKSLLKNKLIACANIVPVYSMYEWEGKIEDTQEVVIIAKTLNEKYDQLEAFVKNNHSYDTPCIAKIDVSLNEEFGAWVKSRVLE